MDYEFVNVHEVKGDSEVCKETIKELEKMMNTVNLENVKLKKIIEEKDDVIQDLENINKPMQSNLKAEKKKIKKDSQKSEKTMQKNKNCK